MKLELRHLAPYLPYGLKCELLNYKSDYVGEKYGIVNGFYYLYGKVHYTFKDRGTAGKTRDLIKPILRPLSDLISSGVDFGEYYNHFIEEFKQEISFGNCSYNSMVVLFENHFDVFGLIEKGLAIDINTLNK